MGKCHVKVTLKKVAYLGDDIGNDWEYRIRVAPGRWVVIPEHTLNHGTSENRNDVLFEGIYGECHQNIPFRVSIWAKEHDLFFSDFNKPSITNVTLGCPNRNTITFPHFVDERFTLFGRDTARLNFSIEFLLVCEEEN